jgi:hypothetical protein|tara:strand:+ start:4250 stop:4384 length:135 start_codon:yes stop_codon:yes gene_type:complete
MVKSGVFGGFSGNTGDVDPSNGDIDPPWILVTKKGYYDKITLIF